jgi:transposase InsO family protein
MAPFQVYCEYLALKSHFTNPKYDYFKYNKKVRASLTSFNRRKDKYFFERLSRKKTEDEIKDYFVANFIATDNIDGIWIGEVIKSGDTVYENWSKKIQSLRYMFKTEVEVFIQKETFNEFFFCKRGKHSPLIQKHLQKVLSLETLVILDYILGYTNNYDKILDDPVWEFLSGRISKYKPFIHIDTDTYAKILKESIS